MTSTSVRLRVNPITCDAFGYCAELLPEIVGVDEWGYPILDDAPVPPHLVDLAARAVRDCPRRALFLEKVEQADRGGTRMSRQAATYR
jgi:ferredoxin